MKSRASTHLLILLIIAGLTALGHYAIYYSGLIRGYETSWLTAGRNLLLFLPLMIFVVFMQRFTRFAGNWTIFTTAILLFSIGLVGQYRLFSDPEYVSIGDKAQAREQKIETLQLRYIKEHYSEEKKRLMGLDPTPPAPVNLAEETPRPAPETIWDVAFSGKTLIPLFAFACFLAGYLLFKRDSVLDFFQNNGFLLVLLTLVPLMAAAVTSRSGKFIGNMTPWEMSKIPFLLGFAAILTILYRNLAKTYWGLPRLRDVVPLVFMATIPFIPFLVLKDFGQMLVFSAAYAALYLIAIKRLPQRAVFVGSVLFLVGVLMVAALPSSVQVKVPLLSTVAEPVKTFLPPRIHQRFHLWFDALNPPPPDTAWWNPDLVDFYAKEYSSEVIETDEGLRELYTRVNSAPEKSSQRAELQRELNTKVRERAKVVLDEMIGLVNADSETTGEDGAAENEEQQQAARETDADDKAKAETRQRLLSLNEEAWFADDAMQSSRATFGISTGGKTGRGLGLGYPELIPVADSDYIYSAIGEEMGLAGGFIILLALIVFVNAGVRTALDARDMFTKLCAAGLTAFIGFQALVNIGGITRALPMTGITLPFVSHGGFSLITSFAMLGMLLAISHRNGVDAQQKPEIQPPK
jgi:cell division protein FtsW (lipid II flippase)